MFQGIFVLCVTFLCALPVFADKPIVEYGNLDDLKDVKKTFIDAGADMNLRDEIGAEIRKSLRAGRPTLDFAREFVRAYKQANGVVQPPETAAKTGKTGKTRKTAKAAKAANAESEQKPVQFERTWDGEAKIELQKAAPAEGYLVGQKEWNKLWKAYRGDEETPKVDFATELALIAVNKDPNRISIQATLDANGDLSVTYRTTMMAVMNPTTCRYQFAVIKREGIKTINGKPIKKE